METQKPVKAKRLSEATLLLFHIAKRSHSLRDFMGIELVHDEGKEPGIKFTDVHRPWLEPHPGHPDELTFSADKFAKYLDNGSEYERHMRLWILNVWNPSYAKTKGWKFDLFAAMRGLDSGNREAIAWWVKADLWP